MKSALFLLMACLAFQIFLLAEEKSIFVDGDSDSDGSFVPTGSIPWENTIGKQQLFPEIRYDVTDQKTKSIKWTPMEKDLSVTRTVIGRYHGHDITDITYTRTSSNADSLRSPFVCKVLAYNSSSGFVPFFVLSGENARWYEQLFEAHKGHPFLLTVKVTMPGNGVFWTNYSFAFSDEKAWLVYQASGGRKMQHKEISYNSNGTILNTVVSDEN